MATKTAAIIAAYNEENHIADVVSQSSAHVDTVIVVDDGSNDDTARIAKKAGATVLEHLLNCGKGAAARTGCDYALEHGHGTFVLLDGDGQHEPHEIPRFLEALKDHDVVFGERKRTGHMPAVYRLGNWGLTLMSKFLFGIGVRDSQCGYRAMSADTYRKVRWDSSDYGMESEMVVRAGINGLTHKELTVKTIYHDAHKGTGIVDGIKIALRMLKWRLTIW